MEAHPFVQSAIACFLFFMPLSFFESIRRDNYSIVDRLWSITPMVYPLFFLAKSPSSPRLLALAILAGLWGIRLTLNLYRKGGYNMKHEDYRITKLRNMMMNNPRIPKFIGWIVFQIFNLSFIVFYQHALIWLISAIPPHIVYELESKGQAPMPWNWLDTTATVAFLIFLLIETVADNQMFAFQAKKYELIAKKAKLTGDYALGFFTGGLFKYSRHPNFLAEQSMWWCFALFTISVQLPECAKFAFKQFGYEVAPEAVLLVIDGIKISVIQYGLLGAALLTMLFQASTDMTERISVSKYVFPSL